MQLSNIALAEKQRNVSLSQKQLQMHSRYSFAAVPLDCRIKLAMSLVLLLTVSATDGSFHIGIEVSHISHRS